jgi:hypothetical protein
VITPAAFDIQRELRRLGYAVVVDGVWGPRSQRALDLILGPGREATAETVGLLRLRPGEPVPLVATLSSRDIKLAHPLLQAALADLLSRSPPGRWVLSQTTRSAADQAAAKARGASRAAPGRSPHNFSPSLAIDVLRYIDGKPAERVEDYADLRAVATKHRLRWGADWNMDGRTREEGDTSERLVDAPHIELVDWKARVGL